MTSQSVNEMPVGRSSEAGSKTVTRSLQLYSSREQPMMCRLRYAG